jgi:hypothetical protein
LEFTFCLSLAQWAAPSAATTWQRTRSLSPVPC